MKKLLERGRPHLALLLLYYARSLKTSVRKVCLPSVISFGRLIVFEVYFHHEPLLTEIIFLLVKIGISMILYHLQCEYGTMDLFVVVLGETIDFVHN